MSFIMDAMKETEPGLDHSILEKIGKPVCVIILMDNVHS